MLIPFELLPTSRIRGIIHIGAHEAEELDSYTQKGIQKVLWIEANPDKYAILQDRISVHPHMLLGCFAAGEHSGEDISLNIANNGQSSSILEMQDHLEEHPSVVNIGIKRVPLMRVDDFLDDNSLDRQSYNFINLDIQGYELAALRGAQNQLSFVDYIYTEVNERHLYKDCPLIDEVDSFLASFGFRRICIKMTSHGWGDAFYAKPRIIPTSFLIHSKARLLGMKRLLARRLYRRG
jgi:FkbM family methyltransferase